MKEHLTSVSNARYVGDGLRCTSYDEEPDISCEPLSVFLEFQQGDTVFASGGLDLRPGEPYYGLHLSALADDQSFSKTVVPALETVARIMKNCQSAWEAERELGPAPRYLTGVTHWRLARLARHAGFTCVRLDPSIFNKRRNARVGWKGYAASTERIYQKCTDEGQKGETIPGYGLLYQPVDAFVDKWTATSPSLAPTTKVSQD